MNKLKFLILTALLVLAISCGSHRSMNTQRDTDPSPAQPVHLSYCELAGSPGDHDGQTIRLKGVYVLRLEASSFYSLSCSTAVSMTADLDAPPCHGASEIEDLDWSSPLTDRAHGVIVQGTFENRILEARTTGEAPQYYRFRVDCVEKIKRLGTLAVYPPEAAEAVRRKILEFEEKNLCFSICNLANFAPSR